MNSRLTPNLKILFFLFALTHLIAPFFSVGSFHPDEHFQILEFTLARLGFSDLGDLPWEYPAKMRSWLLPMLLAPFEWISRSLLELSPFTIETLYRFAFSLFGAFSSLYFLRSYHNHYSMGADKTLYYFFFSLWFLPFLHARISPEVVGFSLFLLALALDLYTAPSATESRAKKTFLVGCLFALCFFMRFHFSFFIFGWYLHKLIIQRNFNFRWHLVLATGFAFGCGISVLVDYWGYGAWTFTPYNYFYQNVVLAKSANFGTSPWWDYFKQILAKGPMPLGVIYLASFFFFIIKKYRSEITWMSVPFLLAHMVTGHKELRFLFPLAIFLPIYLHSFFKLTFNIFKGRKYSELALKIFLFFNLLLMPLATFSPVNNDISFLKYFAQQAEKPKIVYYNSGNNPFRLADLNFDYYVNDKFPTIQTTSLSELISEDNILHKKPFSIYVDRYWKYELLKNSFCQVKYSSPLKFLYELLPKKIKNRSRYISYWECR